MNQAPSFALAAATVTVPENAYAAAPYVGTGDVVNISAGPADDSGQALSLDMRCAELLAPAPGGLFCAPLAVHLARAGGAGGWVATLTFRAAVDRFSAADCAVTLI